MKHSIKQLHKLYYKCNFSNNISKVTPTMFSQFERVIRLITQNKSDFEGRFKKVI
jgi:hypothetical protein